MCICGGSGGGGERKRDSVFSGRRTEDRESQTQRSDGPFVGLKERKIG